MRSKILIVDDEEDVREVIGKLLEKQACVCTATGSADQAVKAVKATRFDLVILDIILGTVNGLDLLTVFKSLRPSMPVLMITGAGFDEELIQDSMNRGACGFLSKGVPIVQLLSQVRQILKQSEPSTPPSSRRKSAGKRSGRSDRI